MQEGQSWIIIIPTVLYIEKSGTFYREVRFITLSSNCGPKGCQLRALRFPTAGRRARIGKTKFCYVESYIIHVSKAQKGGSNSIKRRRQKHQKDKAKGHFQTLL